MFVFCGVSVVVVAVVVVVVVVVLSFLRCMLR